VNCRELKTHLLEDRNAKSRMPALILTKRGTTLPITSVVITGGRLILQGSIVIAHECGVQPIPWYSADENEIDRVSVLKMLNNITDKLGHSVEVRVGDNEIPFSIENSVIKEL
jgi:hypothetical protein